MHVSTHVFSIRVGIILYINTCGKQGRALETAAGNPWSGCLMLAYALGIHYHLFLQREGLYQQAAAPLGVTHIPRVHTHMGGATGRVKCDCSAVDLHNGDPLRCRGVFAFDQACFLKE